MGELSLTRLRGFLKEGRLLDIHGIYRESRGTIFSALESSTAYEELILLFTRVLDYLGYHRDTHKILSHAMRSNPKPALLLEYARSCLDYKNVVKGLRALDRVRDSSLSDESLILKLHGLYARCYALMGAFETAEASLARSSE